MKQLMENWRKLIKESEEENALPQPLPPNEIPEELYHTIRAPMLPKISINGLRDFTDFSTHGAGQRGVSFATKFEAISNGESGRLVLVFDGQKLAESGQYNFKPDQNKESDSNNIKIRIEMVDSASETGSGIDEKVDALGTEVPFSYVKQMIYLYPLPENEQKWLKETFPNVPYHSYNNQTGEILEYDDKNEEKA